MGERERTVVGEGFRGWSSGWWRGDSAEERLWSEALFLLGGAADVNAAASLANRVAEKSPSPERAETYMLPFVVLGRLSWWTIGPTNSQLRQIQSVSNLQNLCCYIHFTPTTYTFLILGEYHTFLFILKVWSESLHWKFDRRYIKFSSPLLSHFFTNASHFATNPSLGDLNRRRMDAYSFIGYLMLKGKKLQRYKDAHAFWMEIEDGRFQEACKRLFSTERHFFDYDCRRFMQHTALIDEFKKKYAVDTRGAWSSVAFCWKQIPWLPQYLGYNFLVSKR
jgi:hypothetical protein